MNIFQFIKAQIMSKNPKFYLTHWEKIEQRIISVINFCFPKFLIPKEWRLKK